MLIPSSSSSSALQDHYVQRIKAAFANHSTSPTIFGQNIWEHLSFASVDVRAYDENGREVSDEEALEDLKREQQESQEGGKGGKKRLRKEARVIIEATVREGESLIEFSGINISPA